MDKKTKKFKLSITKDGVAVYKAGVTSIQLAEIIQMVETAVFATRGINTKNEGKTYSPSRSSISPREYLDENEPVSNTQIILALASYLKEVRKTDPFMPLSLPLLAASAPEHEYTFVDMLADEEPDYLKPVDLIGISVRITAEATAYKIAKKFREKNIKVVLGGAQISSVPYRAKKFADAIVVGEGEPLWPVIVKDAENGCLKDFYVCSPNKFDAKEKNVYQDFEYFDLKKVPVANRKLYKKKYHFDTVFAARGCPLNCDFCSVSLIFGKKIRTRPGADI